MPATIPVRLQLDYVVQQKKSKKNINATAKGAACPKVVYKHTVALREAFYFVNIYDDPLLYKCLVYTGGLGSQAETCSSFSTKA